MINSENISIYEPSNYYQEDYNIISLKESQGFIFNQDLFASPYQQLKSLANEKKLRSLSFNHIKPKKFSTRRHTLTSSNDFQSKFRSMIDKELLKGNAIDDESDNDHNQNTSIDNGINKLDSRYQITSADTVISDVEDSFNFDDYSSSDYKVKVVEIVVDEDQ